MLKKELRKLYKEKRDLLSVEEIDSMSLAIANNTLKLPIWELTYFHLFLTIEEQQEVQTEYLLHVLHARDKEVVISKSDFSNNTMVNYLLTDNTRIKKNKYNIPEPVDGIVVPENKIDVVFIPLLAYDTKGNRVGYGRGFYDNLLTKTKNTCIKIGLSFFEPEPIITDVYDGDMPLDYCVTPETIYSF